MVLADVVRVDVEAEEALFVAVVCAVGSTNLRDSGTFLPRMVRYRDGFSGCGGGSVAAGMVEVESGR